MMKALLFTAIIIVSTLLACSVSAADPCRDDPFCTKAQNSRFDSPNRFIFVGAYPGDELLIYPFMKDHCSENTNYCAMIIATQGKSGCKSESESASSCGEQRTLELRASAEYLNADVWHYDLPDSQAIIPHTLEQTRSTYQYIVQTSGLLDLSHYFENLFTKLQLSSDKPIVIISLNPFRGSISQSGDNVARVLDESVDRAVEKLQQSGHAISYLYANSSIKKSWGNAINKDNDASFSCRNGNAHLLATHTEMTNFEVFKHGFYGIYPSQIFHNGAIDNNSDHYQFCLEHAKKYFSTKPNEKIVGFALNEPSHISEVASFSNAFAFTPKDLNDVTRYLNRNTHNLIPVIEIGRFLFDETTHSFRELDVTPLAQAITASDYQGPILFLVDEPLWRLRLSCLNQNPTACTEITDKYTRTLDIFRKIGAELRKALPGSGMLHIEAFAELIYQKNSNPSDNVILLDDVEYLGYDCYGSFDQCGMTDISNIFSDTNNTTNIASLSIVESFSNAYPDNLIPYKITDSNVINFLLKELGLKNLPFLKVFQKLPFLFDSDHKLNLVCDSSNSECIIAGATSENTITSSMPQSVYIDWIRNAVLSMETVHPIGRKIFLVPGTFQNFYHFPSENQTIDQINAFAQVFDSSPLFGGMGGFIWGDLQEGPIPFIGARSLFNVRLAIADIFREYIEAKKVFATKTEFHPAMSLVGAIGARGSFQQLTTYGATQGDIYFQSAGMDSCSLKIGDHLQQVLTINQLNYIPIPILTTPLDIEAICLKRQRIFSKKMQFVN
ncbi:hypothetical protein W03_00740 [Nitrosomonas sp. PY1]|uniref:hypothetical protein n=1 Tax=Nitrosomonas sp. PY1 TaxID=1803906 RepID=UPI001FC868E4|nr:hypothetical protein [Nitrosomonas sp. PY1]GKS68070.1 hypothetical protein W03_00740 [Nitrosomonas sp. PY1]